MKGDKGQTERKSTKGGWEERRKIKEESARARVAGGAGVEQVQRAHGWVGWNPAHQDAGRTRKCW